MPVYRKSKGKWRVRVYVKGKPHDKVVPGTRRDALAVEAQWRLELLAHAGIGGRGVPTFSRHCRESYLYTARLELKPSTYKVRRGIVAGLMAYFGDRKMIDMGAADFDGYKAARLAADIRPTTLNHELQVLATILSHAHGVGYLVTEARPEPVTVRGVRRLPDWSFADVERLILCCGKALAPLVAFLANTGCRKGEAVALRWSAVDYDRGVIRIEPSIEWQPKGNRARVVPLSDALRPVLEALPRRSDHVFATRAGKARTHFPKDTFEAAVLAAELQGGPHQLRHFYATEFLRAGGTVAALALILGHSDHTITRRYAHLLPSDVAAVRNVVQVAGPCPAPCLTLVQGGAGRRNG